jgi:alcohol dehydrogenase
MDFGVSIVRAGGTLAFVGVPYGVSTFDARKLFASNVSIAGALAPTRAYIDELMADVVAGTIDPGAVLTLRLPLDAAPQGYAAMDDRSTIKVLLDVSQV